MKKIIVILWIVILLSMVFCTLTYLRKSMLLFILPAIGIVLSFIIEYILHVKFRKIPMLRRLLAIPFLTMGLNWICIFTVTTYRSHYRIVIIPLSFVFLSIGFLLAYYKMYKNNLVSDTHQENMLTEKQIKAIGTGEINDL
ncbi:MAG: hypothetical protein KOO69_06570 [Victivallales bacterium]|nr:hypothetical protein [Victivallales bacterium]